ncbi:MAG: hypothetical protein IJH75_02720 [Mogibacterium sp.]|nr:hypothetical protein [Mogibacterium sp.]
MMKKKTFIQKVIREFPAYLPEDLREGIRIRETTATKMNDRRYHGIILEREGQRAAPMIYLDEMYEQYRKGDPFDALMYELAAVYVRGERMDKDHLMYPPENPDGTVTLIALRLLSIDRNRDYLKEGPYWEVGNGLALTCDIRAWDEVTGEWRMRITHEWMKTMGLKREELFRDAMYSCPLGNPVTLYELESRCSAPDPVDFLEFPDPLPLPPELRTRPFVLSTRYYKLGAAGLFYPRTMERLADLFDGNYYVVPTSVHEVLIIPDDAGMPAEKLEELLQYSNRSVVEPEDILSEDLYHYDRISGELSIAEVLEPAS